MTQNTLLKQLGYDDDARVVVLHADDIGMCHATLGAWEDILDCGFPLSSSLMVPCPWFSEAAAIARRREQQELDVGIHITLTSEWSGFRWGPLSTRDMTSGLLDLEGFFPRSVDILRASAKPEAVRKEIRHQLRTASQAGIDVTHIDSHMGAVFCPAFLPAYFEIARENRVPAVWFRTQDAQMEVGLDSNGIRAVAELTHHLTAESALLIDHLFHMPLDDPRDRLERTMHAIRQLTPGITHFMIHPARDTPEIRHITPDWPCRVADYQTFTDSRFHHFLSEAGVQFITYRHVRNLTMSRHGH